MTEKILLDPKCINGTTDMAVDNRGRLIPCCYCDVPGMTDDPEFAKLLEVSYLENYDSVEEILATKQWKRFFKRLKQNNGFPECNEACRKDKSKLNTRVSTYYDPGNSNIIGTYKN
jgi:hypothetical protein